MLVKVLVNNSFTLNIIPMITLNQLPVDKSFIRPNHMMVRVFNGAISEVIGDIDIE